MKKRNRENDLMKLAGAFFENLIIDNWGNPGLDGKRPFGNSSTDHDILEIIGIEVDDDEPTQEQSDYAEDLYESLPDFLRKKWAEFTK